MQSLVQRSKTKADLKDDRRRLDLLTNRSSSSSSSSSSSTEQEQEQSLRREANRAFEQLPTFSADPPSILPPPLAKPVVIPQRRQADRLRGFQLLYAPALADSGVTEQQFITFVDRLNVAIGFDNRIKLFNFAIDIGTLACSSWEMLIATIGTQALTTTAAHIKSRVKSEAYVAQANESFFHPRGLHAQIVPVASSTYAASFAQTREPADPDAQPSSFQFSLGSPHVLPSDHPKARGGLFNLNKRPIEYDPFDYGPGYLRLRPDQYSPVRPSLYKEPVSSLVDKAAAKVEKYNVWQDRLPAKKNARRLAQQQAQIDEIRSKEGDQGVARFLEKQNKAIGKDKSKLEQVRDRNKVILVITNLDNDVRAQMQSALRRRNQ